MKNNLFNKYKKRGFVYNGLKRISRGNKKSLSQKAVQRATKKKANRFIMMIMWQE